MKKLIISLFVIGLAFQTFGQTNSDTERLPEVEIVAVNYKYLKDIGSKNAVEPVKYLERQAAAFDLINSDIYNDEYEEYSVSFYIPEGTILAAYNRDGEIIRTAEKFKDIDLPLDVINSVWREHPGWKITGDVYLVTYHHIHGITKKYKLLLEKDGKRKKIKTDELGNFK